MLGFFTDPYPDELLYSAFSRYHRAARNSSKEATARALLGNGMATVVTDLPSRLDHFIARLPHGHLYSADALIDRYTVLPFFEPFMPPARSAQIRDGMRGEGGGGIHGRLGSLTSRIRLHRLRYCPECVGEDQKQYKEPYWHRAHHLPGIAVCAEHAVFLEESDFPTLNRNKSDAFLTAKEALKAIDTHVMRRVDLNRLTHRALLQVAEDARWLIANPVRGTDLDRLRARYFYLMLEPCLIKNVGHVKSTELHSRFAAFYPPELLRDLHCDLDQRHTWLRHIVQTTRGTHHPIQHLLLMQFLECSAERFFALNVPPFQQNERFIWLDESNDPVTDGCGKPASGDPLSEEAKRNAYRKRWSEAVANNPGISRSELTNLISGTKVWLRVNDKQWLETHLPPRKPPLGPPTHVDWKRRDREMAEEARKAIEQVMSASGRPVRASWSAIARRIGQLTTLNKRPENLPLTKGVLDQLSESQESYAARRVWWAAECFKKERVRANISKLMTRSAVSYGMYKAPEVKAAFDAAVAMLRRLNDHGWVE